MEYNINYANHKWLAKQDVSKYKGNWIAIHNQKIIANGETLDGVVEIVKSKDLLPDKPMYVRIPDQYTTLQSLNFSSILLKSNVN